MRNANKYQVLDDSDRAAARPVRYSFMSMNTPSLYDITPPITPRLGVWPGDTPPERQILLDIAQGATVTLSALRTTVHLGAHADGPSHYGANAPGIEHFGLDRYLGECQVVHVAAARNTRISFLQITDKIRSERVLIATGTFPDFENWNRDFAGLAPELVDRLHDCGVQLVGVDTPSVDLMDDRELLAHRRFLAHDMAILEGLVLRSVPAGLYELIALPLSLVGYDASPVRAVLRLLPPGFADHTASRR